MRKDIIASVIALLSIHYVTSVSFTMILILNKPVNPEALYQLITI